MLFKTDILKHIEKLKVKKKRENVNESNSMGGKTLQHLMLLSGKIDSKSKIY